MSTGRSHIVWTEITRPAKSCLFNLGQGAIASCLHSVRPDVAIQISQSLENVVRNSLYRKCHVFKMR